MLNGRLYIDGLDAYATWGIYVVSRGYNELIAFPSLKTVEYNDWHEEDGIDADLYDPQLNTREAQLNIAGNAGYEQLCEFITHLSDGAYHVFDCRSIGRTYTLRLIQAPSLTINFYNALDFITLKFADDFPLHDYAYIEPHSTVTTYADYLIDERPLTDYGVRVLEGSLAEILKPAQVKQNLMRNIVTLPGASYDDSRVTFKSKDVKIRCLMRAKSLPELWHNYDALLYDLTRPGERELYVAPLGQSFPCHYKNATVNEFYPDGKIWLDFSLTLTFTRDFRINNDFIILVAEDGSIITTEDEQYIELISRL